MIQFRSALAAIVIGSAAFSRPAMAQYGERTKSMTHVVSATIAPRVKTRLAPAQQHASNGIGLSVIATQAWVLSIKAGPSKSEATPQIRWASSPKGEFKPLPSTDTVLVAGNRSESPADTALFFRDTHIAGTDNTVLLTVSAP